jgi:hypothetical protein
MEKQVPEERITHEDVDNIMLFITVFGLVMAAVMGYIFL